MIYFLQSLDGGPIKIGFSADVPTRVRQLESHYRQPLAVLATMEGERAEEAEIHSRFAHLRLGRTEQFQPAADLMAFIGRPLLVGANPEAVEALEAPTKPRRAKLPADVLESARIVAALRNVPMADLLAEILRPALKAMEKADLARRSRQVGDE